MISYRYDGTGQRIYKKVVSSSESKETHYVRDGSGNILATYEKQAIKEFMIYGASRIGTYNGRTKEGKRTLGNKKYELSNHLGNVLAVISDNKLGVDNDGDLIADSYKALIISESDYYQFGMSMKERSFSNQEYCFGFNTQEKTPEIGKDTYTAEFWQYDSKTARRWNVDPVAVYWETPYAINRNNPIQYIDPNGNEPIKRLVGTIQEVLAFFRENNINTIEKIDAFYANSICLHHREKFKILYHYFAIAFIYLLQIQSGHLADL